MSDIFKRYVTVKIKMLLSLKSKMKNHRIVRFCLGERTMLTLAVIILVGILLRVYRFEDWLLFNPDQARDAMAVYNINRGSLPLLGPIAGGTEFHLGPITYYFS